jgi:hypothetical protein
MIFYKTIEMTHPIFPHCYGLKCDISAHCVIVLGGGGLWEVFRSLQGLTPGVSRFAPHCASTRAYLIMEWELQNFKSK